MALLAKPQGLNPCPRGHELHNLGRQFYGHHNNAFGIYKYIWEQRKRLSKI